MKMVHHHHIFNIFTVIEILFSPLQRTMLEFFFFFIELRYQPLLERNIIRSRWITTLDRYLPDTIFSFFFFFFLSQQLNSMKNTRSLQLLSIIETNASIPGENYLGGRKILREILEIATIYIYNQFWKKKSNNSNSKFGD